MSNPHASHANSNEAAEPPVAFREAIAVWLRIGLLSFGGPAAQIALMHRMVVDERKWLSESQYLNALGFCMLLPGPEAMQLATYSGWRLHGVPGGLAAGLLFVLPGALVVLALAMIYAAYGAEPLLGALFLGIKAAVVVIVVEALLRISRRALKEPLHWLIAALAFIGIFFLAVPFPVIVLVAGLYGLLAAGPGRGGTGAGAPPTIAVTPADTAKTIILWLAIWIVPLAVITVVFGRGHVLADLGWFFSKLAVVTFGGAYAVLSYMGVEVADGRGWLTPGEVMDGLGLAETTPGPLILVTEFVGYLAAHRHGGGTPWTMGLLGAVVTLWATFAPCFLWIFAGAPYVERLNAEPRLKGALAAITAAVVGVILNLAIWFALHVVFTDVGETWWGPLRLTLPASPWPDWRVLALAFPSAVLLLRLHWSVPAVLAVAAALGLVLAW